MHRGPSDSAARLRAIGFCCGVAVLTGVIVSCTPAPPPAGPAPVVTPVATASSTPHATPELLPGGTALENLPLFTTVTTQVWAGEDRGLGRAYIDALVAAGFPKERMQVTADRTTIDRPAESLQFSVAWGEADCLIGQVGPSTGEPVTAVMPQLPEGRCLIGQTRPIDW